MNKYEAILKYISSIGGTISFSKSYDNKWLVTIKNKDKVFCYEESVNKVIERLNKELKKYIEEV